MKLSVKRDQIAKLTKAKIELSKDELITIRMALRHYKEWTEEQGWHQDKDVKYVDMYKDVKQAYEDLEKQEEWK